LSGLLRGRLGTEAAIYAHNVGERFVLLDRTRMQAFDPSVDGVGRPFCFRPAGPGDLGVAGADITAAGRALFPLSPAHLVLAVAGDDVSARWIRRSRGGFGWPDFVDAPLSETGEAYRVEVTLDGRLVRVATTNCPRFTYAAADRLADGDGRVVSIAVAQLSALVGPGGITKATIDIGAE
jgi:hypothetical protein